MKLKFTATLGKKYHHSIETGKVLDGNKFEIDDVFGQTLIKDYPENFSRILPSKKIKEQPHKMVTDEKPKTKYKKFDYSKRKGGKQWNTC